MDKGLLRSLKTEQRFPFEGFDFSHLRFRLDDAPLPWSYVSAVIKEIRTAKPKTMVDMGTGGGEILSQMRPLPKKTFATESYKPQIKIARKRLEPLGVKVVLTKREEDLPFENDYFDLVINRHCSWVSREVSRVLKKGGMFITQGVGGNNNLELMKLLGTTNGWRGKKDSLGYCVGALKEADMEILKATEAYPKSRLYDAAALVYLLKGVPWVIPDFSIERYGKALSCIDAMIEKDGYVEFWQQKTFIIARKP
jgi:SAM-dependent methyltransferase